jgi:hypothetical protein
MKNKVLLFVGVVFWINLIVPAIATAKIVVTEKDKTILQGKLDKFSKDRSLSTGELVFKIGLDFMATQYVGKTLDLTKEENLVVNLRELDCTTFVENCLAIALTVKQHEPNYEKFTKELERIRYRNGLLKGYTSRLHYFSEWMIDNESKGVVKDIGLQLGGDQCKVMLNYMSTHPESYPQLKGNPSMIAEISQIEKRVSSKQFYFIPKDKIATHEEQIKDGDIVALVTRIPGMDVSHIGLLFKKEGRVFMLHAPLSGGKVETTKVPIADYLKDSKNTIGIFVVRAM